MSLSLEESDKLMDRIDAQFAKMCKERWGWEIWGGPALGVPQVETPPAQVYRNIRDAALQFARYVDQQLATLSQTEKDTDR